MPLFPAYASNDADVDISEDAEQGESMSPAREVALLASDSESNASDPGSLAPASPPAKRRRQASPPPQRHKASPTPTTDDNEHFYIDRKLERSYYGVSTLYWPGRPQYKEGDSGSALGAPPRPRPRPRRARRYWARGEGGAEHAAATAAHAHERAAEYRRRIAEDQGNEKLWMDYLDCLESGASCSSEAASLVSEAASRALAALPASAPLAERLHRALRQANTHHAYIDKLKEMITEEPGSLPRALLWLRLLGAACGGAGAAGAGGAARAALAAAPHQLYPHILYVYGSFLSSAGLWEQLCQLIELVLAMSSQLPAPPGEDARAQRAAAERDQYEMKCILSGLPSGVIWSRVERARAALQWRPLAAAAPADPQSAPPPHAHADLLVPLIGEHLHRTIVTILRLTEVPLMPVSESVYRLVGGAGADCGEAGLSASASGSLLVAVVRAARRLPPAHPAAVGAADARALAAAVPLRPYSAARADPTGFGAWRSWVWAAGSEAVGSSAGRGALLAWRLRELHARRLLAGNDQDLVRALRQEGRALVRAAGAEAGAGAAAGAARLEGGARGARAAGAALRALWGHAPHHHLLYLARVYEELSGAGAGGGAGRARAAAVLRRRDLLPAEGDPPLSAELLREAYDECCRQCSELESSSWSDPDCGRWWWSLVPGGAEWAAARVALAPRGDLAKLACALMDQLNAQCVASLPPGHARALESWACAVSAARARLPAPAPAPLGAALALQKHFPNNAYIALAESGGPWWSCGAGAGAGAGAGPVAALCRALPALLRHERSQTPADAVRAARACGVIPPLRWEGGPLLAVLGMRALAAPAAPASAAPAPAAPAHDVQRALDHAITAHPHCKALYCGPWAGAAGAAGAALADLVLDRGLRLHALPDELAPEHYQRAA